MSEGLAQGLDGMKRIINLNGSGSELEHVGNRLKAEGSRVLQVKYDWLLAIPKLHLPSGWTCSQGHRCRQFETHGLLWGRKVASSDRLPATWRSLFGLQVERQTHRRIDASTHQKRQARTRQAHPRRHFPARQKADGGFSYTLRAYLKRPRSATSLQDSNQHTLLWDSGHRAHSGSSVSWCDCHSLLRPIIAHHPTLPTRTSSEVAPFPSMHVKNITSHDTYHSKYRRQC